MTERVPEPTPESLDAHERRVRVIGALLVAAAVDVEPVIEE